MCVANFIRIAFTIKKVMAVSCPYVTMFVDQTWYTYWGPRRGPHTNFEENPTTLSGLQRLKAKMTRKNLADVDEIYKIFVSMYYTLFL